MSEIFLERPNPFPRESALGWALRAAELNALPDALKLATLCKNFHATTSLVNFNPGELASWFDKAPSILGFMSYRSLTKTSPPMFRTQPVAPKMLNLRTPRICPSCVEENGYIHAFWDLDLVSICPTHRIALVTRCSACNKHLSWKRPGLLICSCGAKIKQDGVQASKSLVTLHQQLEITAYSKQTKALKQLHIENTAFKDISLRFLIKFIETTARIHIPKGRSRMALSLLDKIQILEKPAELLSDWPTNFCNFLALLNQEPYPESKGVKIFDKRFLHHYIEKLFVAAEDYVEGAEILDLLFNQVLTYPNSGMYRELTVFNIFQSKTIDRTYCSTSNVKELSTSTIKKLKRDFSPNRLRISASDNYIKHGVRNQSFNDYLIARGID